MDHGVAAADLQSPCNLYLRLFSMESPASWRQWGRMAPGCTGVWRFYAPDRDCLLDLVEVLMLHTPAHELNRTIAFYSPAGGCDDDSVIPLKALDDGVPLPVLHARLHHPWIMRDLAARVEIHLQPIVDLMRRGQVFAHEALCRVRTPGGRLLSGYEAFALAKQAYRAKEIDLASIRGALLAKANLMKNGTPIFVNVLPQNFIHLNSPGSPLRELPESLGIPSHQVVIELVESEHVNPEALADACDILHGMGFRITLDDFGTGYNSLSMLATLRPDFVKFDRNLVHGIQGSRVRMVLLEALVSMAQRLGCATIAEGLERVEDVIQCRNMGVHYAQGYFFAKPAPVPVIPELIPHSKGTERLSSKKTIRPADYVDKTITLPAAATAREARDLLGRFPDLPHLIVLDAARPIGYAHRFDLRRAIPSALVTNYCHPVTKILRGNIPGLVLAQRFVMENRSGEPWIVVNDDNEYLGTLEPSVVLPQVIAGFENGEHHPLSLLPTGPVLRSTLDRHLQAGDDTILVYVDIDHFKAFNDRYGFVRGDAMIKLLAEILRQQRSAWPDAYVGHIGGDDFIVIFSREIPNLREALQEVMDSFHRLSAYLYDSRDLQKGFFETPEGEEYPVAALSIIVVNGSQGSLSDGFKAGERAARLKKMAKACRGSALVMEGNPPLLTPVPRGDHNGSWQDHAVGILSWISSCRRDNSHHDLDLVFKAHPYFELIYELDRSGIQRYPNWINPRMRGRIKGGGAGIDRNSRPYFREVRDRLAPYVSNVYLSSASEDFCVTVSVPLMDESGVLSGVLVADINLPGLVELFRSPCKSELGG